MSTKKPQDASAMLRSLDSVTSDKIEVHIAACTDTDTLLKTFTTPARRCRSHADCVLVSFRPVRGRRP